MLLSEEGKDCIDKAKSIGWDLSLSSMRLLMDYLDNPQDKIRIVHVTGTNGKGSVCAFLSQILIEAGCKVGRYNSPAIENERERYTINDSWIKEDDFSKTLDIVAKACNLVEKSGLRHPSLFEVETALAFLYFYSASCDLAIIEVGMGGLLDATNVIKQPLICAFTPISLEHQQWLGNTLSEITKNKAGIIKDNCHVVSCIQEDEAGRVLKNTAKAHLSDITFVDKLNQSYEISLKGAFQYQNAAIAVEIAKELRLYNFNISDENICSGLKNCRWPFRFEKIHDMPCVILDGAHNLSAVNELKKSLLDYYPNKSITFVVSVLADKAYKEMFDTIFPIASSIILVESKSLRALSSKDLYKAASDFSKNKNLQIAENFSQAANLAINEYNELIVCFGTFTFLNDIKNCFKEIFND